MTESDAVEREVRLPVPPAVAWTYWTDPERIVRWMGSRATLEARPGGTVRVEYGNGAVMLGEVVELDPPRRLVLTWGWEDPAEIVRPGESRVEVTFEGTAGGTLVRVRHLGLPESEGAGHAEGWDYFLGRLGELRD